MPLLVISLLTALTLWVIVQDQNFEMTDTTIKVPLRVINIDSRYVVTDVAPDVAVQFQGPKNQLSHLDSLSSSGLIECVVDLQHATEGTKNYNAIIATRDADIRRLILHDHTSVRVKLEKLTSKQVPVTVVRRGQLSDPTTRYDAATIVPPTVTFVGRKSRIESIASARVSIDLGTVDVNHAGQLQPLAVVALDAMNRDVPSVTAEPATVSVGISTVPATVDKELFIDPQFVGLLPAGYEVESYRTIPAKILVTGSSSTLSEITSLRTRSIDLTTIKGSTSRSVELLLPPGIHLQSQRPVRVILNIVHQKIPAAPRTSKPADPSPFPDSVPPLNPVKGVGH